MDTTSVVSPMSNLFGSNAMFRPFVFAAILICLTLNSVEAEQVPFDFGQANRAIVHRGTQALMICNGLFVSNRTLDQVYDQELKLKRMPIVPRSGVTIDRETRTVAVAGTENDGIPTMRAAYREGFGSIILAPNQTFDEIDSLPELETGPATDRSAVAWPDGDQVPDKPLAASIDPKALEAAADFAFDRVTHGHPSQITLSLLVVHKGDIVLERYAPGVDSTTKTRTWSAAKSIACTLIGVAVDQGKLQLDEPLNVRWRPRVTAGRRNQDPRQQITLRNVLNMSSGLYPVDNDRQNLVGSALAYFAGASSARAAVSRGLVRAPGTHWDYENYDTILGFVALKRALGNHQEYLEFPKRELFDKIGMFSTVPAVDRFGDYVMSSQVYTNARDLARLGLLYLNGGTWRGQRILSESWIDFVRTPAASTHGTGRAYGGQWWLVPDSRRDVPKDAYSMAGNRGQFAIVVPSLDLVIVRRGLDWLPGEQPFSRWDLLREVVKALPRASANLER